MSLYDNRKNVLIGIFILIYGIFVIRLFYLQVVDETYKQFAERNVLQRQTVYPNRGLIFDRYNQLVVSNQTIYDLMVVPSMISNIDTLALCKILAISKSDFETRMARAVRHSRFRPSIFLRQLSSEEYGVLQERLFQFRGFFVQSRTTRGYVENIAPHIWGYLGEVDSSHLNSPDKYYRIGDYTGISGLESNYETYLRGERGLRNILVDVFNREQGSYLDGKLDIPSKPGNHLITTIDAELQAYGELLMQNKTGSIVAIEPSTGEILTMVSSPTFDPSALVGRGRAKSFRSLAVNEHKPLFNRSVSAMYPPGSAFKPINALIALQEGVLRESDYYTCRAGYHLPGLTVRCHSHPRRINVKQSIQHSCNAFYCHYFRQTIDQDKYANTREGFEVWRDYLNEFGLLSMLGIDLQNERRGFIPTADFYDRMYGNNSWRSSTILSLSIGQGEVNLTPLQMANMTAVIANNGYFIRPHIVRSVVTKDSIIHTQHPRYETNIDEMHFKTVREGLEDVISQGTAWRARVPGLQIAGKTGTSQNPHGENHAVFIGYAPADNPEIAIAVVVENAGYGGAWAAPIASLMMEMYIRRSISNKFEENRILEADFITPEPETELTADYE